jgi:hypothetical protein
VLIVGRERPTQRALALGGAGDVALLGHSDLAFTAGLASFLASPAVWIIALRRAPARQGSPGRTVRGSVRRVERLPVEAHRKGPRPGHYL